MADATYADLLEAARQRPPRVALVLGSGLGGAAAAARVLGATAYLEVPGLSPTSVPGHQGRLVLGEWSGQSVLIFGGRLHRYEGHAWRCVTQPVHVARQLGAWMLIATNAAGGIREDLTAGTLMLLRDHVDTSRAGWWRVAPVSRAPRRSPYSTALFARLRSAARHSEQELAAGVYAQVTGPCFETKAEIRALAACGVDAVGMSTAREIATAAAMGMQCAAISCITNRAAGLCDGPIAHDDVLRQGPELEQRLARLLGAFFANLDKPLSRMSGR